MKYEEIISNNPEAVAIIGLAGRFPKAASVEEFWENICQNKDCLTELSREQLIEAGVSAADVENPSYVRRKGSIDRIDCFDANFFGFTPNEARLTDPQHRLFLEVAWDSFENAGYNPDSFEGEVGVFASCGRNYYLHDNILSNSELLNDSNRYSAQIKNDKDYVSTTVSYKLGLSGPSINLNTACSSSLVSIHYACMSLANYECDMAIAGATSVEIAQSSGYMFKEGMILSNDGICRPFDDSANGTVPGNGVGVVVLKRLEDAVKDRDYIYSVILGSAVNNDGNLKVNYSAPSVEGQSRAVVRAYENANISPESIDYIEAHGTGTVLGDPVEIEALKNGFKKFTHKTQFCSIGSVKANVGHLDAAAGMAGLIKVTKALEAKVLPPLANFNSPNRNIDFLNTPFYINREPVDWVKDSGPRRAAVNSLGIGGTNVHVILQEAPTELFDRSPIRPCQLFLFSAKSQSQVVERKNMLNKRFSTISNNLAGDIAFSLSQKKHFEFGGFALYDRDVGSLSDFVCEPQQRKAGAKVSIILPGLDQAKELPYRIDDLYLNEGVFRKSLDKCSAVAKECLGINIVEYLMQSSTEGAGKLNRESNEIALFAIEYSLGKLLQEWGCTPNCLEGNGIGKFAAICLADCLTVEDAILIFRIKNEVASGVRFTSNHSYASDVALVAADKGMQWDMPHLPLLVSGEDCNKYEMKISSLSQCIEYLLCQSYELPSVLQAPYAGVVDATVCLLDVATDKINKPGSENSQDTGSGLISLLDEQELWFGNYRTLLTCLGKLWSIGVEIDWTAYYDNENCRRIPLLGYPFDRTAFWITPGVRDSHVAENIHVELANFELYTPEWKSSAGDSSGVCISDGESVVVFSTPGEVSTAVINLLKSVGRDVVTVMQGGEYVYDQENNIVCLDPRKGDHYGQMWIDLKSRGSAISDVIYLWSVSDNKGEDEMAGDSCLHYPISLLAAYAKSQCNFEMQIKFVTNGMHNITGTDFVSPSKSLILGVVNTVPWEFTNLTTFSIDIDLNDECHFDDIAARICTERAFGGRSNLVAYRGRRRWLRDYEKVVPPADFSVDAVLRRDGVYIVTGGLGGIGLELARAVAENARGATLVLVSRSSFPAPETWNRWLELEGLNYDIGNKIKQLMVIESLGSRILIVNADISQERDVQSLKDTVVNEFGKVNGIIHAAGIHGGGLIRNIDHATTQSVLQAKVTGTKLLNSYFCTSSDNLDFMLLCSSVTAIKGGVGEVAYTAANSFLDAFSGGRPNFGNPVVRCINWTGWRNTGMLLKSAKKFGFEGITPQIFNLEHEVFKIKTSFVSKNEALIVFSGVMDPAAYWPLGEHKIGNKHVLPAAAFIDLVVSCARESFGIDNAIQIENLIFLNRIAVENAALKVKLEFLLKGEEFTFSIVSKIIDEWQENARGTGRFGNLNFTASENGVNGLDQNKRWFEPQHIEPKGGEISFGRRWTEIDRVVRFKDGCPTITLSLPECFYGDCEEVMMHPSLLDVALYGISPDIAEKKTYFPFSISSIRVYNSIGGTLHAVYSPYYGVNEKAGTYIYDVTLYDESRNVAAELKGVTLKSVRDGANQQSTVEVRINESSDDSDGAIEASEGVKYFLDSLLLPQYERFLTLSEATASQIESGVFRIDFPEKARDTLDRQKDSDSVDISAKEIEAIINKIYEDVLGVDRISLYDDFFDIGGDSLGAVEVIDNIKKQLHVQLRADSIFDYPTVEALSSFVGVSLKTDGAAQVIRDREFIKQEITKIFEEAIGEISISGDDDFFDLGGDSLTAIQVSDDIKKRLNFQLRADAIFDYPTIETLALHISSEIKNTSSVNINGHVKPVVNYLPLPTVTKTCMQLFCFHHAGGGTTNYRDWYKHLPDWIEVILVQLPGRENLFRVPAFNRIEPLVDLLHDTIRNHIRGPFALFGHSMGGMIAFELSRKLQDSGVAAVSLNIAAFGAPSRYRTKANPSISDVDLKEQLREQQPSLKYLSDDVLDMMLPTIRADFSLCDNYKYHAGNKLQIPINLFCTHDDSLVKLSDMDDWHSETDSGFTNTVMEGGHFFIESHKEQFLERLSMALTQRVESYVD